MAYIFSTQATSQFKITDSNAKNLNFRGVNSTLGANNVINGVLGLMYIAGRENDLEPLTGLRTVKEDVEEDE